MKRARFIGTTAAFAAWTNSPRPAAAATAARSLWVWQTPLSEATAVTAFAVRNAIKAVFLSVPAADRSALDAGDAKALRALRAMKRAGLGIYCVAGDPSWVTHARSEPPQTVGTLFGIHRVNAVFDGIALDVEPHTLPDWKDGSRKDELAKNYLALLRTIRSFASILELPVLATVHPTYAKYTPPPASETLLQSAARAVDMSDLMAYRNAETTLESFGGEAMQQLAAVGKPWWLGVSTHTDSPDGTSYATLSPAQFFPDTDATAADLAKRYGDSFLGISVEDYRNTASLFGRTN